MAEPSYSPEASGASYRIGGWTLCTRTNRLTRDGAQTELESRLVHLLVTLIDHRGEVLDKDWLLRTVWAGRTVTGESLMVAISQLRKALGDDARAPVYIKTVPGKGYQLLAEAERIRTPPQAAVTAEARRPVRWDIVLPVACVVLFCLVLAAVSVVPKPPAHPFASARKDLHSGDPARQRKAIRDLTDLATRAPSAMSYTGLANAKKWLLDDALADPDNCHEVIGLLDKALEMDPAYGWAYDERAQVRFMCRHDAKGAEVDYQVSRRLNDDDETALHYSGLLLAQGRFDESLAQIKAARRRNPLHYSGNQVVWLYQMHGRDDLAWRELRRLEGGGADDRWFHISALRVYTKAGRGAEAFTHLEWLMRADGVAEPDIAAARAALRAGGMKAVFAWLLARKETKELGHYKPPLSWARYALEAGRNEEAMVYLEQAFAAHQMPLLWAEVDPAYAPVRDDPRFKAWMAKMKTLQN